MQRKRHINFKFWKVVESSTSTTKVQKPYLHSIPILSSSLSLQDDNDLMKNKVKSNVLYSIPCSCILALLLVGVVGFFLNEACFAAEPSASLVLGASSLSTTATQGSTAYLRSNITASSTGDIENYTLSITGPVSPDGTTVLTGANNKTGGAMSDNTWGYSYDEGTLTDNNKTYKSFTGAAQTLESGTTPSGQAKNITFAAKFGDSAITGHYRAEISINLVVTPKIVSGLTGINSMQEMTSEICAASKENDTKQLTDMRDGKTYWVTKLKDNNCWMTQNLDYDVPDVSITTNNSQLGSVPPIYNPGTKIVSGTSLVDIGSGDTHYLVGNYYSLSAATDGSSVSGGQKSICPTGWRLPTGNTDGEYVKLTNGLSLSTLQASPYYFSLSGSYGQYGACSSDNGCSYEFRGVGSDSGYWTSSAQSYPYWYAFRITSQNGATNENLMGVRYGFNVRCIAN